MVGAKRKDRRNAELAKIHLAKKQLGLEDVAYRDILEALAKVRSAADLDEAGRRAVLDHLARLGFQDTRKRAPTYPGRPHNTDGDDQLRKIEALLAEAGRPWAYAAGILKRMYGEDAPARLE